jgi:DNA helicase II / ATP-dependent DNA helicase PcrA
MALQIDDKRQTILDCNSNMIVLGGPGSGKTTIALVKADKEISSLAKNKKILFLSFARATVARVQESASQSICRDNLKSIEVSTYHGFFWNILKSHGYLISSISPLTLISPADAAVKMSHLKAEERQQEFERIFKEEGIIGFDLFAQKVKEIFSKFKKLRDIYCRAYPIIIVDEFQDTNSEEWDVIKLLGQTSRIIALADADQRIYEFRGADPARIGQFMTQFTPKSFDFGNENNRSNGTDITIFGNDLLSGANRTKTYSDVFVINCPYYKNLHEMYLLKTNILSAINRLKQQVQWSIAVLVPTKKQMLVASNYLSSNKDNLSILSHDVAIDAEGPTLAGSLFSSLLEKHDDLESLKILIAMKVINYIRGKNGAKPPAQADLAVAASLEKYIQTKKRKPKIFTEIESVATARITLTFSGNPLEDWMTCLKSFSDIVTQKNLVSLQEDSRYVRLLHKGSQLREALSGAWKTNRFYKGAEALYQNAIQQENFSSTVKAFSGIHVMTIHKSKGKQFDEVFIYEGYRQGRIVSNPADQVRVAQARLTLRVGITRAQKRATILTPSGNKCELL